jgi:hypothetical protein
MSMHMATRKRGQKKDAMKAAEAGDKKTEWLTVNTDGHNTSETQGLLDDMKTVNN